MKKSILFLLLSFVIITKFSFSQEAQNKPGNDYWGTFCLVSYNANDTNYFKVDLTQLPSEFEKVYFKNYFLEQDVFHTRITTYNIQENTAIIAVPQKYKIDDFRHFMADMKKMTFAANYNWDANLKNDYLIKNKAN